MVNGTSKQGSEITDFCAIVPHVLAKVRQNQMKVILLQDVAKIGRRYEIVEVPHGFALNKLVPQGLAKEATPANIKHVEARKEHIAAEHAKADETFSAALTSLADQKIEIAAAASETGHLFEAVKSDRIAAALQAQGIAIEPSSIHIGTPIKNVGTHTVDLVSGEQRRELSIEVVSA